MAQNWKETIRQRLAHLPYSCRETTIAQVIADTEAGRPFGEKQAQEEVAEIMAEKKRLEEQLADRDDEIDRLRNEHGRVPFNRKPFNQFG